jgi:uncharacterized protein YcbX
MPTLTAITRFPIKGFGPDQLDAADLEVDRALAFDRHWAIENGGGAFDPANPVHLKKKHFLMLAAQPDLASIPCQFDMEAGRARFEFDDGVVAFNPRDPATHAALFAKLGDLLGDAIRGQLSLVHAPGQAMTDKAEPYVSLINSASVRDLADSVDQPLGPLRFRGNLLIDGAEPWAELGWVGRTVRIGNSRLRIDARIRRCVATSVNPQTAQSDADVPAALHARLGHMDCGIYLTVIEAGQIRVGDGLAFED